jgi:hypothetical protein
LEARPCQADMLLLITFLCTELTCVHSPCRLRRRPRRGARRCRCRAQQLRHPAHGAGPPAPGASCVLLQSFSIVCSIVPIIRPWQTALRKCISALTDQHVCILRMLGTCQASIQTQYVLPDMPSDISKHCTHTAGCRGCAPLLRHDACALRAHVQLDDARAGGAGAGARRRQAVCEFTHALDVHPAGYLQQIEGIANAPRWPVRAGAELLHDVGNLVHSRTSFGLGLTSERSMILHSLRDVCTTGRAGTPGARGDCSAAG